MSNTTDTTGADFAPLVVVLGQTVSSADTAAHRIAWLLELADALDALHVEGAENLAEQARTEAFRLVRVRLLHIAGRS